MSPEFLIMDVPRIPNLIGRPDGQFMTTKKEMDKLLLDSGGNIDFIKTKLGIPSDMWNEPLYRIDVPSPLLHNARMPTGFEQGANPMFKWGGFTSGGMSEIATDSIPKGAFNVKATGIKP